MGTHPIFESDFDCLTGQHFIRNGNSHRGKPQWDVVSIFEQADYADLRDVVDLNEVERKMQVSFETELAKINAIQGGFEAETIGDLTVKYDGDIFTLADLATLASSRNIVKASVAGCPELIMPIIQACTAANLQATSQQEMITIKIPPTTTDSRKRMAVAIQKIVDEFSKTCDRFIRKTYVDAIECNAHNSEHYAEDMESESSAKAFCAHLQLTLETLTDGKIAELKKGAEARSNQLLGTSSQKTKKRKR